MLASLSLDDGEHVPIKQEPQPHVLPSLLRTPNQNRRVLPRVIAREPPASIEDNMRDDDQSEHPDEDMIDDKQPAPMKVSCGVEDMEAKLLAARPIKAMKAMKAMKAAPKDFVDKKPIKAMKAMKAMKPTKPMKAMKAMKLHAGHKNKDYTIMWYKASDTIGIRRTSGIKPQVISFGGRKCTKNEVELRAIAARCLEKLGGGSSEATVKDWAKAEASK